VLANSIAHKLDHKQRLADTGAAEQADLAPSRIGSQQIDGFDPRDEDFPSDALFRDGRTLGVNGVHICDHDGAPVDRVSQNVEHPAKRSGADRYGDRAARIEH
jgi:hypothetical protein